MKMQITLAPESEAKLDNVLEQLSTYYDLEDLSTEELVDALLEMGVDLVIPEGLAVSFTKNDLIALCSRKIQHRV